MKIKFKESLKNCVSIGLKAKRLHELIELGCKVPNFVVIPSDVVSRIVESDGGVNEGILKELQKEIAKELPSNSYAVRSSALIEDGEDSSYAGQFKTEIDVDVQNLPRAIISVVKQAFNYLKGDLSEFAVIVQSFIEPDMAGVVFTRSPVGGREMVFEYSEGRGEAVVSGQNKPHNLRFLWNAVPQEAKIPDFKKAVESIKMIEDHYQFPQDVEWCVKGNEFFFLQARPISTISKVDYAQIKYLDDFFKDEKDYYYEKTGISEIAPRPTELTLDLLRHVYKNDGPVDRVYKQFNIKYQDTKFFRVIGNELFSDKDAELKSLFPAQSILNSELYKPAFATLKGLLTSISNIVSFGRIAEVDYSILFDGLKAKLEESTKVESFDEFIKSFLLDYELIFKINFLAGFELQKLKKLLDGYSEINSTMILSAGDWLFNENNQFRISFKNIELLGNSLDIQDETPFVMNVQGINQNKEFLTAWLGGLPINDQDKLRKQIKNTLAYTRLREMGRWYIVKEINELRKIVFDIAERNDFVEARNIYFANLKELQTGKIREELCLTRRDDYERFSNFSLPSVIKGEVVSDIKKEVRGISSGIGEGFLIKIDDISIKKLSDKNKILYTKILAPDLVLHFGSLKGIVSENGGELSHLAIMAREYSIPVITGVILGEVNIGDHIKIDGGTGKIEVLS